MLCCARHWHVLHFAYTTGNEANRIACILKAEILELKSHMQFY
jgi:hypothetical protein